ncbi:MAG: nucleotidyltransferase domain-containing protein, partial [Verrucomicrobiota bacterium]|nr:nucleotidyltransferase domain-containing protein [Verrucomicrobiota bacterium]
MIDVNPHHLETIKRILREHVPDCEVRAFGSRVDWTAKDYSDLDLVVVGEKALPADTLRRLREAFEESDLPFRVDVLDWYMMSEEFRRVIERQYEIVQSKTQQQRARPIEWREMLFNDAVLINPPVALERGRSYPFVDMSALSPEFRYARATEEREFTGGGSRFQHG